jgi:hypothetical protein
LAFYSVRIVAEEGSMKAPSRLARARLRSRKTKLDVKIARDKRTIKTLTRRLRKAQGTLSKRVRMRRRIK